MFPGKFICKTLVYFPVFVGAQYIPGKFVLNIGTLFESFLTILFNELLCIPFPAGGSKFI